MDLHNRIVHLDLKGAPLKVLYLEKVLLCIKEWGATGIVLEWEDTFPYSSELIHIGSQGVEGGSGGDALYSYDETKHILSFAKKIGLEVIQLVQTIGHMEFVLKHMQFKVLREATKSAAVLCPSQPESLLLVKEMLRQVLDLQPDANYLHIGADEVWHTAICGECQHRATNSEHKAACLYLDHIRDIALFLKQERPLMTVLMWDDMLRSISPDILKAYKLGDIVQPVVWNYNPEECFHIQPSLWDTYIHLFPNAWAGSAFKGANGSSQMLSPVSRYVSNQEAWLQQINKYGDAINFVGVILTGWSRYDHYATLCELLPVSLPSLASCLKCLKNADVANDALVSEVLPSSQWPGEELARCVHSLVLLLERCFTLLHGDLVATWLNPWQLKNAYTNPVQIEGIVLTAQHLLAELTTLQTDISTHLHVITGKRSTEEFVESFIAPTVKKLSELCAASEPRVKADASIRPSVEHP